MTQPGRARDREEHKGPLSVKKIERMKGPCRRVDQHGLYLEMNESGAAHWLFRYVFGGRERWMGLGALHTFDLKEARERARLARQQVKDGIDPIEARRATRAAASNTARATITFREAAKQFNALHEKKWKNRKSRIQFLNSLEAYAFPIMGNLTVDQIDTALVLRCIEPLWTEKSETMARVRARIERILDWAAVRGYRTGDNPARWRGHLSEALPSRDEVAKVEHHPALPFGEMPGFWSDLAKREGVAAKALAFTILTAARSGETLGAQWAEINFETKTWTIPGSRMKAGREHKVPLSDAAIAVLTSLHEEVGNSFVFPGSRATGLSNMSMSAVVKRMKVTGITIHGFRSTFRDWAAETTSFPNHVVEMALAHTIGDAVEKAYRRGDLFAKRKALMDAWAKYCATPVKAGVVVPMRRKA